jgi:hypothetical protein
MRIFASKDNNPESHTMKKIFGTVFFLTCIVTFFSCEKKAKEFEGRWQLITAPVTAYDYFWLLGDAEGKTGEFAIYVTDTINGETDTCTTGNFFIKNSVITIDSPALTCQWSTYDGEWDVHRLNDQFMTLIRYLPRGTVYLEFIKR